MAYLLKPVLMGALMSVLIVPSAFADLDELEGELLQTEAIMSDTEAAQRISEETTQQLARDRKEMNKQIAESRRQRRQAKVAAAAADKKIAANEKAIARIKKDIAKAKKDIQTAKNKQTQTAKKQAASDARLKAAQDIKKQLLSELKDQNRRLDRVTRSYQKTQKKAVEAARISNKAKSDLRGVRKKLRQAVAKKNNSYRSHRRMLGTYRNQLNKALKQLDRLELILETDKEYGRKLSQANGGKEYNVLSGLNYEKSAKIKASNCRVREFPNAKSSVIGSYRRGQKLNVSYHNSKWYTLIYSGQKAFIGKACI